MMMMERARGREGGRRSGYREERTRSVTPRPLYRMRMVGENSLLCRGPSSNGRSCEFLSRHKQHLVVARPRKTSAHSLLSPHSPGTGDLITLVHRERCLQSIQQTLDNPPFTSPSLSSFRCRQPAHTTTYQARGSDHVLRPSFAAYPGGGREEESAPPHLTTRTVPHGCPTH